MERRKALTLAAGIAASVAAATAAVAANAGVLGATSPANSKVGKLDARNISQLGGQPAKVRPGKVTIIYQDTPAAPGTDTTGGPATTAPTDDLGTPGTVAPEHATGPEQGAGGHSGSGGGTDNHQAPAPVTEAPRPAPAVTPPPVVTPPVPPTTRPHDDGGSDDNHGGPTTTAPKEPGDDHSGADD